MPAGSGSTISTGRVSPECEALFSGLLMLTVFMEKTARKGSGNSSLPPSQTERDESARRAGGSGKGPKPNLRTGGNLRKTAVETCGADLSGVDAEIKECPDCRARTKGRFPDDMPRALCSTALASKPSLSTCWSHICCPCAGPSRSCRRSPASAMSDAFTTRPRHGKRPPRRIFRNAGPCMPTRPASGSTAGTDGCVVNDGGVTMKFLHRKRGREAIDEIGIIPRCKGVLIYDCRASFPGCGQCSCQLCGSCLLRELTFVIESDGFCRARPAHQ